jgi:hypothetical protein
MKQYKKYNDDFSGFIEHLVNVTGEGREWDSVNTHFRPQTLSCSLDVNRFNYELKLERRQEITCLLYSISGICPVAELSGGSDRHHTNTTKADVFEMFDKESCLRTIKLYRTDFDRFDHPVDVCEF